MRMPGRRIALVGAMVGVFASAYLLVDYVFGSGICLTGSGCDIVRSSSFAYPLGIPMPLLGLGFYLAAVALLLLRPGRMLAGARAATLAAGWSLIGLSVMAALTFVGFVVIGAICSWCLLSAAASILLAGGAISAWRHAAPEPPVCLARSPRALRQLRVEDERSRHDVQRFVTATASVLGIALVALLAYPALTSGTPVDEASVGSMDRPELGRGPVEVVVFSDFQCPACAVAAPVLSRLSDEGTISLSYRYFPLVTIHPNATAAAEAAQAAALQGRFWEYHDALFASQAGWAKLPAHDAIATFEAIATGVGLDVERWRNDAASSGVSTVVATDAATAQDLRLSGTPTIFIDGTRYGGPLSYVALRNAVEAAASAG